MADLDEDDPLQIPAIPEDSPEPAGEGYSRQDARDLVLWNFETHS